MIYALSRWRPAVAEAHLETLSKVEIQRSGRENEETVFDPRDGFLGIRSQGAVSRDLAAQSCPDFQTARRSKREFRSFCDRLERQPALRYAGELQGGRGL